ncbi:Bidirectional sugar transporter SWEET16 [Apostasia shenzhenica]|uniref:Bidirectional sugar transporter SWEET n=1 Tax=Apostasia shenzhenica TaxID=1088818 RepID=A0A2I0AS93_9ASPA|nr:Bidirectional sugar transporter SWEET16 [Apostasia shenzhenica]
MTLLSTSLWTYYGLLKPDGLLVVTVNGTGTVLQAIYVLLYLFYAPKETRRRMAKWVGLLNLGAVGVVILITYFAIKGNSRLLAIGSICAALTVGMYAAPLSAMALVVKTKSVEYMPFTLSFFLFLNGGIWTIYSAFIKDYFIGVPNVVGFVLGSAQLAVYGIYRHKKSRDNRSEESDSEKAEEGSARLMMGHIETQNNDFLTTTRRLSKGSSLPKPSVTRQNSFSTIIKTISLTPYELQAVWRTDGRSAL